MRNHLQHKRMRCSAARLPRDRPTSGILGRIWRNQFIHKSLSSKYTKPGGEWVNATRQKLPFCLRALLAQCLRKSLGNLPFIRYTSRPHGSAHGPTRCPANCCGRSGRGCRGYCTLAGLLAGLAAAPAPLRDQNQTPFSAYRSVSVRADTVCLEQTATRRPAAPIDRDQP